MLAQAASCQGHGVITLAGAAWPGSWRDFIFAGPALGHGGIFRRRDFSQHTAFPFTKSPAGAQLSQPGPAGPWRGFFRLGWPGWAGAGCAVL